MVSSKTSERVSDLKSRASLPIRFWFAIIPCLLAIACGNGWCQDQQPPAQVENPSASTGLPTIVHGIVRNGATGDPLPRALVRINGDASTGVLTDGEGRFEIADVPSGPQEFTVVKPGFMDHVEATADSDARNVHGFGHNVIVISQMGDIVFTMVPLNSIEGTIQLSTGDVAEGIQVALLRRTVQDGRVVWQKEGGAKTNVEGVYRFGELVDGLYAVYTEPTMDSNAATNLVEAGSGNKVEREGYASTFYPDARDLTAAAQIRVASGMQAQANISLALEPFHSVTATADVEGEPRRRQRCSAGDGRARAPPPLPGPVRRSNPCGAGGPARWNLYISGESANKSPKPSVDPKRIGGGFAADISPNRPRRSRLCRHGPRRLRIADSNVRVGQQHDPGDHDPESEWKRADR